MEGQAPMGTATVPDVAGRDLDPRLITVPPVAPKLLTITDATGTLDVSVADVVELLAFVKKAGPVVDQLVELLPAVQQLTANPGGVLGLMGSLFGGKG